MRKTSICSFALLTTLLLIGMSSANVSAVTGQDLGDLWTIVNDIPDSIADYDPDDALYPTGGDTYTLDLPVGDGKFYFFIYGEYEDNHLSGTNTGEHVFRMNGQHYSGITQHCNPNDDGGGSFYTNGGDRGSLSRRIDYPESNHMSVGDTVVITISAGCEDLGDDDIAEVSYVVTVTIVS